MDDLAVGVVDETPAYTWSAGGQLAAQFVDSILGRHAGCVICRTICRTAARAAPAVLWGQ